MSRKLRSKRAVTSAEIILFGMAFVLGCGGIAAENVAIDELRKLEALVVLDVNKHASSVVLPNDAEKIQQAIPLLSKLKHLISFGAINTPITDEALVTVGKLKGLTNVDVSGTGITDAGVGHLVGLSNLSSLNLADTKVTSDGLAYVGKLSGIDMLNLSNTNVSGGFGHLVGCKQLSWMVLSHLQLSDADAAAIAEHPNLKRLSISTEVSLSDEARQVLVSQGMQVDL